MTLPTEHTATPSRPARPLPPLMALTDRAADRLRVLYETAHAGQKLRIAVSTKGCSGHAYDMNFVDAAGPGDEVVTDKGVTVLVDRKATLFLIGTTMDYETRQLESGFTFSNPNEKGRCGCGESFHV
ncbi:iron-sulfur cluster assembly accessory protein [Gluconacetobacter diazotrophicus PA1 5]|uniref:Iron-sulfur cluster assembly accessory protein n=2 Tax=Gluconacetobacter diazotrophicus TaxID=33996 RepID=A0A7W4NMR9_GLUDI|nr:iron-sulfur cluster assembly accessory protein [Gluconacetobacter diazotrophicus]ACI53042.1 iron-sulfur cluster assembly accessory protein [Gluconacetobacter diazotrophicus PA1 5]MBB2157185.1 iron-sulfur cluster assembly accessory protein [Gluconacetobacter diazotrophicus]TWB07713.1 iron-binding apoprotein IscA [Gluconacetobacter diazotrophicus]CAP56996.1 putative iron-binding protein iscA [Gluconacetobacter diazotrophicus PA1 5]